MKPGPRPKPTALKKLEGNPGKRALPKAEPTPPPALPDPPEHLSAPAKRLWHEIGPKFLALGLMTDVDREAFAIYVESYTTWAGCVAAAREDGAIVEIRGVLMPNPYLSLALKMAETCRKFIEQFGGSPSSRSRLSVTTPGNEPADELQSFLKLAQ